MQYFVHERAICESSHIGAGTRIWAFAHILPEAKIGIDCNVCDNVFIENDVVIGDRVTIKCGVQLWDGIRIQDDVFIGPNATFCNDRWPRSKKYPEAFLQTVVESGASIGANATILPGLTIGREAMIGAGAVVTKPVPPHAVVVGNPARIVSYSTERQPDHRGEVQVASAGDLEPRTALGVGACSLIRLPAFSDMRGGLVVADFASSLPFTPKRCFFVHGVPNHHVRGEHAHRVCEQVLLALCGSVNVMLDDGQKRAEVHLDSPHVGLYMPAGIWGTQYRFSDDAILAVFASLPYEANDYIREYAEFLRHVGSVHA